MRLRVGHEHSQFWPILGHLVDYYSLFCGPRVIFTINERRGAFTCRPSTLTIFPDSGLFPGLFLTVLGVPELFPWLSSGIAVWVDSGPFLGLLLSFGVPESFTHLTNPGVPLRVGHQHT